ncbi:beta-ketoacyl synthase domain-containing protein [Colletotrichum orchidophilum]|uniref:Beta-ketoacyl synthase domain-containing protein n=1 Tax=Colletotrichum orchidophilum TaxID=1209926 RepID=A0A1G4B129_9PEZI|nr:beta-ketoacyl synthase domain-containing protein [Colletotrichum orchidophilum]OHE95043.1 beta-ketoacyl synthase domain-containing protein [Colletotrichum orchidophilum]
MSTTPSSSSWDHTPDAGSAGLLFFGNDFPSDHAGNLFRALSRSSAHLKCAQLAHFIKLCNHVLKDEISKLPKRWQDEVPCFDNVLDLIDDEKFRKGPLGGAVEGVFLIIFQIGMLIGHHEIKSTPYEFGPRSAPTLAGLGVGLLSAAAVSAAPDLAKLGSTGAQAVRVAFRLGIHVYDTSEQLEPPQTDAGDPWAFVVPGLSAEDVQAELDGYNAKTAAPVLARIFISAADQTSVTISGPPNRLRNCLKSSGALRYSNFFPLPVHHGLCHAPHIYHTGDVQAIISGEPDETGKLSIRIPLLSSDTGRPYEAEDLDDLLGQLVVEILMHKMHIDNVAEGIAATLEPPASLGEAQQHLTLWTFRSSMVLKAIIRSVEGRCEGRIVLTQHDLVEWSKSNECEAAQIPRSPKRSKLAVVGMSCRLPGGADDTELFWKLMMDKRDVHTTVPPDRFDLSTHFDPTGRTENATQTPFMNYMENPGHFDAGFFNISPKEAEQMDPMHRLALVTAYEALEMSGYAPNRTRSTAGPRIGTYYGQASDDWRELNASQNIGTYAVPSGERGFANGRINYFFKFSGPSFNMDTACSSGLAAVNAACSALWAGEVDTALAGGLNVITDPDNFCQLGKGHFLSLTGQCKVWDEAADGYCRADGVGSVVIKRLDDALADNDTILATILAANTNHSAEAVSITHPHAPTQADNYRKVMAKAGISPLDVSYVELHGTGTQAGDREEARSVSDVFAPAGPGPRRKKKNRLRLGAVKSNIGHGEAAAGIASFIKVLLMYQKGAVPPQIGVPKLNPTLPPDLEERNVGLNWEYSEWPRTDRAPGRLAVVNSFGAHGGNTTVLLADPPDRSVVGKDPRSVFPLVLSARSKSSLKMNAEALLAYLDGDGSDTELGHLSYTLTARRIHHPFRIGDSVKDIAGARRFLSTELDRMREQPQQITSVPLKSSTVAFAFTGQGAFYEGMGARLYAHCAVFREAVDRLDLLAQSLHLDDVGSVVPIIEGTVSREEVSPVASQVAIVLIELALTHYWAALGVRPSMVMGHSLGEFAALAAAGVLSDLDALHLAAGRAKLMGIHCKVDTHGMMAVRCTPEHLREHLAGREAEYEVACFNGESDLVISASRERLDLLSGVLTAAGVKSTMLKVPYAFHSEQMDPVVAPFLELAEHAVYKAPRIPVISPLLAECIFDSKTLNHKYLGRATREPVDVVGALDAAQELGLVDADTVWIDIGPHVVAGTMVRRIMGPTTAVVASLRRGEDDLAVTASSLTALHLAGVPICWNECFQQHERAHRVLHLPAYRWNNKNYWIPYLGTWTLDKAHIKENLENQQRSLLPGVSIHGSRLKTSTVHGIVSEFMDHETANLVTLSNLLDPAFVEAVEGHRMNNHGVASSSIWADMAFTVGKYLHELAFPQEKDFHMNLLNMEILHAQVAGSPQDGPQLIQLEATLDIPTRHIHLFLYNVSHNGTRAADPYGSCEIQFQNPVVWDREWKRVEHLVVQRIESLHRLAGEDGTASRVSRSMAYKLFKNVVDYAEHYRGMQSVVLQGYEAVADVVLDPGERGVWHTPPHWTDSLCHLGGFVMNGSDASDTAGYFYVTPGWESFRLRRAPRAGGKYRSYVRMVPTEDDPKVWAGDVYILEDDAVVGMMGQMKFRQINRILMDRFFSPASATQGGSNTTQSTNTDHAPVNVKAPSVGAHRNAPVDKSAPTPAPVVKTAQETLPAPVVASATTSEKVTASKVPSGDGREANPLVAGAVALLSSETGIDALELTDNTTFVQIGVDSLMSLVLVEKFKAQLQVEIKSSLFIECETLGQFKEWLEENR